MKITITIDADNDAFQPNPAREVSRLLSMVARRMIDHGVMRADGQPLLDINGNTVGTVEVKP